jgi:sugar O-acyltransferase (sialic acid O-acetyltransferase NeuD family)
VEAAAAARPVLIWGAGGHGRVVAELVRACGRVVRGFVDHRPPMLGHAVAGGGLVVALEEELVRRLEAGEALPAGATRGVPAVGDNAARLRHVAVLGARAADALVHPSATCSPSVALGPGTVVLAGAVLNAGARAGAGVIVNSGAIVEHDCVLEDGVHVSPGAVLAGHCEIGRGVWIGAGATVVPRIRIGAGAVVAAGAVVVRDVASGVTVSGVPARARGPRS